MTARMLRGGVDADDHGARTLHAVRSIGTRASWHARRNCSMSPGTETHMVWTDANLHVLVVDDELEVREALAALLEDEGFGVALAADGVDALKRIDRLRRLDVIVCDLDMPRLDGIGLVRALRRRGHHQAVVILSGRFDLLASTADLGQVYALAKPVDIDRLIDTLREAVEKHC